MFRRLSVEQLNGVKTVRPLTMTNAPNSVTSRIMPVIPTESSLSGILPSLRRSVPSRFVMSARGQHRTFLTGDARAIGATSGIPYARSHSDALKATGYHRVTCGLSVASTISVPSKVVCATASGRVLMCSRTPSGFTTASRIIEANIATSSDVTDTVQPQPYLGDLVSVGGVIRD